LMFREKPLNVDSQGKLLVTDVPKGIYEMYLDPLSLPIALIPIEQTFRFQVESGQMTELSFPVKLSGGTVTGQVIVSLIDGKTVSAENIVVIAVDKDGKEVAYTYVDRYGYYTLSEIPPGEYTIKIDQVDIQKRNLSFQIASKKVNIPLVLDDIVEVNDIDFEATQSVY
ncbi:MAG TPA: carboxypeptidase-like regulatory domain-containing protein, partial [Vampirovibrionales bacterium]